MRNPLTLSRRCLSNNKCISEMGGEAEPYWLFSRSDGISLDAADIVDVAAEGASDVERAGLR